MSGEMDSVFANLRQWIPMEIAFLFQIHATLQLRCGMGKNVNASQGIMKLLLTTVFPEQSAPIHLKFYWKVFVSVDITM